MALRVWMTPTPNEASNDTTNSINQIVLKLHKYLQDYDVQLIEDATIADLHVAHAGQGTNSPPGVAHCHGLYPTAQYPDNGWHFSANAAVINNLRNARLVTVPSQWVADILRRDMHLEPYVVPWAIDPDEWEPGENQGYVLWNKTRIDRVCTPDPLVKLAAAANDVRFLTTFGDGTPNIRAIGRQPYDIMKGHIRNAAVYLATTKETWGIGTVEAMACGIPVLGYNWGGTADLVAHGITGYLAEPGDDEGLLEGLRYCLQHRAILGANARAAAREYTWDKAAAQFAQIYRLAVSVPANPVKVSVVIPCHNYAQYVSEAIESVQQQTAPFSFEIIVVNDRSDDLSADVINQCGAGQQHFIHLESDYGSPARARNWGIEHASGDYIVCLDADDKLGSPLFLQTLAAALDVDRALGIAFTSIRMMDADGNLGNLSGWPKGYDFDLQMQRRNQVPTCCMFRKEAWRRAGGYRQYNEPAEDAELWLRIGALGYKAKHVVQDGWFIYRLHSNSLSSDVRIGKKVEPDWTKYHPWTKDDLRPLAAGGIPVRMSWPVRNYDEPEVTIVIPVGPGHEQALKNALDSVEGQTHRHWECLVVNDTGKVLDLAAYPWAKQIETGGGFGAGAARNTGAAFAKAPFLTFLDADDMFEPRFLEATLKAYRRSGRYVYTDWLSRNKQGQIEVNETPEYSFDAVFNKPSIHAVNVLIPRKTFEAIGGFDEGMAAWEDVDFFMKLLVHGYCGIRVAEPLFLYDYQTGKRRETGETIKAELKALLVERYGEYMRGDKVCSCVEPPKGKQPMPPTPENLADFKDSFGDMVKVQYVWDRAPGAAAELKGPMTRVSYGRRSRGDIFYVWDKDFTGGVGMFAKVEDFVVESQRTVKPPAPVLMAASA